MKLTFGGNGFDLLGGGAPGEQPIKIKGSPNRFGRIRPVPRYHDQPVHPCSAQGLNRPRRLLPELVGEQKRPDCSPVSFDKDGKRRTPRRPA